MGGRTTSGTGTAGALLQAAYRAETGLRDLVAGGARRLGWTTAALTYPGYAGRGRARVLGRVLLAPPGTDPGARRDVPGWRRMLTLEQPGGELDVTVGDTRTAARADESGFVDVTIGVELPPGTAQALLHVPGRHPASAPVHVASPEARRGVVCDIDDTVWITGLRHPLRAAWRTFAGSGSSRRPVEGMATLLGRLVEGAEPVPVVYLSNGPWNLAGTITGFLERHGFPAGALLMTDWGLTPRAWFRDGKAHKRGSLERLLDDLPELRWVLVGDDGEHDPEIYRDLALRHPLRVAAVVLRTVAPPRSVAPGVDERVGEVPVVRGPDGAVLADRLSRLLPDLGRAAGGRAER